MKSLSLGLLFLVFFSALSLAAPVDINHADARTLSKGLSGIGPSKAASIVADRSTNGPFKSVDDLARVKGVGPALVERNRSNLKAGSTE